MVVENKLKVEYLNTNNMKKYISWRRVSTKKQGNSGLGLEAQKGIIKYFIEREGGDWVADFEECYTGTDLEGCVELRKAIAKAKKENAVLIIAKTDRFRNTIEALQVYEEMGDGNIMFCDLPHTDKFTLTLFFALAEREALIVSIRTKQALAAKKERGEVTGGASDAWRDAYESKTKEQLNKENMQRGATKNRRHFESRDIQVFLKVLRNIFPDATQGEVNEWLWDDITTKDGIRQKVLLMMKDYKELDQTLFVKWDFSDIESRQMQVKLASYIGNLRKSAEKYSSTNNE